MLKKTLILGGLAAAALALAALNVQGAKGRGAAVNENGKEAHFAFNVKKATNGNRVEIGGDFHFKTVDAANHRSVEITMPRARGFEKDGQIAAFGGPSRAVFMEGRNRIVREGPLRVRVNDQRAPTGPAEPRDLLGLRFEGPRGFVFEFGGRVMDGDLVVYER